MTITTRLAAPLLLTAATLTLAPQPALATQDTPTEATIKLDAQVGDEMTYRFETRSRIRQRGGGQLPTDDDQVDQPEAIEAQLPDQTLRYTADLRFTIRDIKDDGAMDVAITIDRYEAEFMEAGQTLNIERDLTELRTDDLEDTLENLGAIDARERALIALARTTAIIEINPSGAITDTRGFDTFVNTVRNDDTIDNRIVGFFTDDLIAQIAAPVFDADGAIDNTWAIGDNWQTERSLDISNAAVLDYTYDWRLAEITPNDNTATIAGRATLGLRTPTDDKPLRPTIEIGPSREVVTTTWNLDNNHLAERRAEFTQTITFRWQGAEQQAVIRQVASGRTTIEHLK